MGCRGWCVPTCCTQRHDVVLYEADDRPGGHSHTHRVELSDATADVDTGFLVYNERTYPLFCRLLDRLGVATQPSDMSFSVAMPAPGSSGEAPRRRRCSPSGATSLDPRSWRMLVDIGRFNRLARGLLEDPPPDHVTLEEVLGPAPLVGRGFRDWYLVPLGSSIWSADPTTFTRIPAATFARFFERHGLLRLRDQPRWRTVTGGSQTYVQAILRPLQAEGRVRLGNPIDKIRREPGGVELVGPAGRSRSTMSWWPPTATRPSVCCRIPTGWSEPSSVPSATNPTGPRSTPTPGCLPRNRRAWASWNYHRLHADTDQATLTYHLNQLQAIPSTTPVL